MHSRPVARIAGQLVEVWAGQKLTYGGSSDTEVTDWQAKPTGRSPSWPVITATPVQKCPEHGPHGHRTSVRRVSGWSSIAACVSAPAAGRNTASRPVVIALRRL